MRSATRGRHVPVYVIIMIIVIIIIERAMMYQRFETVMRPNWAVFVRYNPRIALLHHQADPLQQQGRTARGEIRYGGPKARSNMGLASSEHPLGRPPFLMQAR
jgi:hypothetical protein